VDAAGQNLIYYSTIPTLDVPNQASGNTGVGVIGLAVDPLGAAWVAGASASASVPQTDDIPPIAPNAFLLKIDPTPDQADLQLSIQSSPANFTVGKNVTITFAIQNLGPAAAQDVVFTVAPSSLQGALMASCQATGSGVCSIQNQVPNPSQQAPRVAFDSIVAGASETVTLVLTPTASPYAWVAPPVLITPSVSAATSDISQNNNTATAVVPPDWVSVYIHSYLPGGTSDLGLAFSVGGASPAVNIPGLPSVPILAAPTATIQVSWASPQMTSLGSAVTFRSWSDGDTSNPRQFSVGTGPSFSASAIFEPFSTPYITAAGVTNAGSYAANGVSPGEIIALFGLNFGTATNGVVNNRAFTTTVAGTTIFFDGVAAPLIYVSPAQANAVVPYEVAGQSSTTIAVQSAGGSMSLQVPVLPAVPALFTLSGLGMGQVAALNQDGTINSPLNPANPGDVIVLFGTGEGLLQPVPADGAISSIPAPAPILPITVAINYQQAQVLYAAEAPSLVAGVIQMNVRIPAGIAQNQTVPVTWSAGLYFSPGGTTIAVK
jgi:uncharacterized protein (TIGR03437 family)